MKDTLLSILLLVAILVLSAIITNWFAQTMYRRCTACGTLNAKRRTQCRSCQAEIRP
ncbi:MAG TPA: hypothetical protein VLJ61_02810 [Pyrinomonadaceae bacterium]|nr:hypothetical protein [Pyrinomonadaceae bacterium]